VAAAGIYFFANDADRKLMHAVQNSSEHEVKIALDNGANPNIYIWPNKPLLIEAVKTENSLVVGHLLRAGANANISSIQSPGVTPLFTAVFRSDLRITEMLLKHGAKVDVIADLESGSTLVMIAVTEEKAGILKLLLERGADATVEDAEGRTALMLAEKTKNAEVIAVLKKHLNYE